MDKLLQEASVMILEKSPQQSLKESSTWIGRDSTFFTHRTRCSLDNTTNSKESNGCNRLYVLTRLFGSVSVDIQGATRGLRRNFGLVSVASPDGFRRVLIDFRDVSKAFQGRKGLFSGHSRDFGSFYGNKNVSKVCRDNSEASRGFQRTFGKISEHFKEFQ